MECGFCDKENLEGQVLFENRTCLFISNEGFLEKGVLEGSGMIIPRRHRDTVFDLTEEELRGTFELLEQVKEYLDKEYKPDGYTLGWNVEEAGGQNIFHAHFHVLPRYKDEPLAGKGLRYFLKQDSNRRKL